ncbi:MFS transporter [Pseudofrankia sp. BMG5.36]|nr:MFS transporter [Pseudofrankia sp. BMG5.36]
MILISYLMIVMNVALVVTALPRIHSDLRFTTAGLAWVQSAYTLAFGGLLLLGARAGDILGRRRVLVAGLLCFVAASPIVGLAGTPTLLLAGRALQGVAAALIAPSTLALLAVGFPEGRPRTRAVAYYGSVAGFGATLGLVAGGLLTDTVGWRAGFFFNVPIGLVLVAATFRSIDETARRPGDFDLAGSLASTAGMSALVLGLVRAAGSGWSDPLTLGALVAGVLLLTATLVNEERVSEPIIPLALFRSRQRSVAYAGRFLYLGAMLGFWFFVSRYLQDVLGYSALAAGLAFLPMTLINIVTALAVPRLTKWWGNTCVLSVGLAITATGMFWLSRLEPSEPYLTAIALPILCVGAGQGLALAPLTVMAMDGVGSENFGAASGLVNVAHQLGGSVGLAALVAISGQVHASGRTPAELLTRRASVALDAGGLLLVVALCLLFLPRRDSRSEKRLVQVEVPQRGLP